MINAMFPNRLPFSNTLAMMHRNSIPPYTNLCQGSHPFCKCVCSKVAARYAFLTCLPIQTACSSRPVVPEKHDSPTGPSNARVPSLDPQAASKRSLVRTHAASLPRLWPRPTVTLQAIFFSILLLFVTLFSGCSPLGKDAIRGHTLTTKYPRCFPAGFPSWSDW